jgi:hypothetical protein
MRKTVLYKAYTISIDGPSVCFPPANGGLRPGTMKQTNSISRSLQTFPT